MSERKEMSAELRAFLAFALSILILVVWGRYFKPAPQPAPPAASAIAPGATGPSGTAAPPVSPVASLPPVAKPAAAPAAGALQATQEETIAVESPLYRVEISNRGGVARSWQLKKYFDNRKPPQPLDLINATAGQQLGAWPLSLLLQDPQREALVNSALFEITPLSASVQAPADLKLEWSDGHLDAVKLLHFSANYQMSMDVSVTFDGQPLPVGIAWRGGFGDPHVVKAAEKVIVYYDAAGKLNTLAYNKLGVKDHVDQRAEAPGAISYAGIEDQFFTAAFLADSPGITAWHWKQEAQLTQDGSTSTQPIAEMGVTGSAPSALSIRMYVGPKDLTELNKLRPPLEELVQFGFVSVLAKPLLEVLKWVHSFVPNYGWAIVVFTLILNMALFPLKVKSFRSMKKTQKLQPEMAAIKQRYAKYTMRDPRRQKMNEEMMELYKREGISPVGGCLPMLLQLPIWWAFYRMLNAAIELRHAPWFGWIHDLSARDPYYILPILMVVTMYWMQKMTPVASVDPMQQKLMAFMPLMMGFLFFNLSSGLVLYIFTSNLVGMGQQFYINHTEPAAPAKGGKKNR